MSINNKNFSRDPDKRITLYEGWNQDPHGSDEQYFDGSKMLFDRIVAELQRRGYGEDEIANMWAYGHCDSREDNGEPRIIKGTQLDRMWWLADDIEQSLASVFDEAWGDYDSDTRDVLVPTVTICLESAFRPLMDNTGRYAPTEGYATGTAIVLEVILQTPFGEE